VQQYIIIYVIRERTNDGNQQYVCMYYAYTTSSVRQFYDFRMDDNNNKYCATAAVGCASTQRDRHPQVDVSRRRRWKWNNSFIIQSVRYTSRPTLSPSGQQHPLTIISCNAKKKRVASTFRGQKPRARAFTVTTIRAGGVTGCSCVSFIGVLYDRNIYVTHAITHMRQQYT
jgi:hypothetical protein